MNQEKDQNYKQLHTSADVVDLHAHPSLKVSLFKRALGVRWPAARYANPFSVQVDFPKMQQGGLDILLSTIYVPEKGIIQDCQAVKLMKYINPRLWKNIFNRPAITTTLEMIEQMEKAVQDANQKNKYEVGQIVHSAKELSELLNRPLPRPVGIIHNVEGGHSLSGDLKNINELFNRGVAYLTPAHFYENELVNPVFPYPSYVQIGGCFRNSKNLTLGLKSFGQKVIERMSDLGMLIDITHCTPAARKQIYKITGEKGVPVFASHIGVYAVNPNPYNLKDWELEKIAATRGVVGIIFMNYWLTTSDRKGGIDFIMQTINHIIKVAGVEAVSLGTDFDGFTDPPDDLMDIAGLENLTQRLVVEGLDENHIKAILGGNALRMLQNGWGKKN